jgi:hypothetical protein
MRIHTHIHIYTHTDAEVYALVFPAVQYLCTKSSPEAACIPNGLTESWDKFKRPETFDSGKCNAADEAPAPYLKFLQVPFLYLFFINLCVCVCVCMCSSCF